MAVQSAVMKKDNVLSTVIIKGYIDLTKSGANYLRSLNFDREMPKSNGKSGFSQKKKFICPSIRLTVYSPKNEIVDEPMKVGVIQKATIDPNEDEPKIFFNFYFSKLRKNEMEPTIFVSNREVVEIVEAICYATAQDSPKVNKDLAEFMKAMF